MEEIKQLGVYNPTDFPLGVLSSNKISPFYMTGKEQPWGYPNLIKGTWKSVTEFVYINMFSDAHRRSQMKNSMSFAFSAMIDIQAEIDRYLFEEYVKLGLYKKITENKNLLYKLSNIKAYNLIYEETPYIIDVLNQIRYPKNKLVYYSTDSQQQEAIFVSVNEAARVLHGVETEIKNSRSFNDNETYINLIRWSKPTQPEPDMIDWIDLDNLVPLARLRLRNQKIIQDIEIFKNVLLDTFLDYVLETEYPYLEKTLYERAKTQQLEQETSESIQSLKNKLYDIFLVGGITDVHKRILQRTQNYQPLQFVLEPYPAKTNQTSMNSLPLDLNSVPELLPAYESMTSIDGKPYLSVIHYAYDMMIKKMIHFYPGLDLSGFDINTFRIEDLSVMYATMRKDWTDLTLRINNEAALEARLKQNPSVLQFLFQTDPYPIIWEDLQDPILGVYNGTGQNITGNHLMFLRERMNRKIVKNKLLFINQDLANNSILQLWLYTTSLHLRNTLLLFDSPTTRDLEYLYSVPISKVNQRYPNTAEQQILESAGLTKIQIKTAFPMILVLASQEFGDKLISESEIAQHVLRSYIEKQYQYQKYKNVDSEDYEEAFEVSKQYLSQATEHIKLAPGVDTNMFIKSMLAGKRVQPDENYIPTYENLSIWSAAFSYFVVNEPTNSSFPLAKNDQPNFISQNATDLIVPVVQTSKKTIKMRRGKKGGVKQVKIKSTEDDNIKQGEQLILDDDTIKEGELLEQLILDDDTITEGEILDDDTIKEGALLEQLILDDDTITEGEILDDDTITEGEILDDDTITEGEILDDDTITEGEILDDDTRPAKSVQFLIPPQNFTPQGLGYKFYKF